MLVLALALVVSAAPATPKELARKPLKVIAPDLIVESFEFGEFPDGAKKLDPATERFHPTQTTRGGFIGYRLKLKTSRDSIIWRRSLDEKIGKDHDEKVAAGGLIYEKWIITEGFPKGRHAIRGWIEGVELPAIYYTVR